MTANDILDFVQRRVSFGKLTGRMMRPELTVRFSLNFAGFAFVMILPDRDSGDEKEIRSERTVEIAVFEDWSEKRFEDWLFSELIAPAWEHELREHYTVDGVRVRDPHEGREGFR